MFLSDLLKPIRAFLDVTETRNRDTLLIIMSYDAMLTYKRIRMRHIIAIVLYYVYIL